MLVRTISGICRVLVSVYELEFVHFFVSWIIILFYWQPAPVILLRAGTDTSQGKPQIISNINACEIVVDAVATTLGPRGMDKLIVDRNGSFYV